MTKKDQKISQSSSHAFHSRRVLVSKERIHAIFFAKELLYHFSKAHSCYHSRDGLQILYTHQESTLDHAVSVLQMMLRKIDLFRSFIYFALDRYVKLILLSNDELAAHLKALSSVVRQGSAGSRDYAYCVLSLFWALSPDQLGRFALQDVMPILPNAMLADSAENPFIPGKIMMSPLIACRFRALDSEYKVNHAGMKRIFRRLYDARLQDKLFLRLRGLLDSLPAVTVRRVAYHRSHECGYAAVGRLLVAIGMKASYRQTLAHELAHIIYRRYFLTPNKLRGRRPKSHTEKRVLFKLLRQMRLHLPTTKKYTFLKTLSNSEQYRFRQKNEEFLCDMFALLVTHPECFDEISRTVPYAFHIFSLSLRLMMNRMHFLRRESLLVPSLSELLNSQRVTLKELEQTRDNGNHAQKQHCA